MKRYVAAELRRTAVETKRKNERHWKRFYYRKTGVTRGALVAVAKARWMRRLGSKWRSHSTFAVAT